MSAEHVQKNDHMSLIATDIKSVSTEYTSAVKGQSEDIATTLKMPAGIFMALFSLVLTICAVRSEPEPLSTWWGYPIYLLGAIGVISGVIMILISLDRSMHESQ